jgi:hypothetical protein
MELIPIILTVLEIVAGLTILTLIISYISLKIKQKNTLPVNEKENISNLNSSIGSKVEPTHRSKNVEEKAALSYKSPHRKDEKENRSRTNPVKPHKKEKAIEPKARLKVLKQLSRDPAKIDGINKEEPKNRTNENLQSLDDNVFDKYSDSDQHEMFPLHVKENKDKSKEKK